MGILVIRPSHLGGGNEQLKRIILVRVPQAFSFQLLDFLDALLAVPGETKVKQAVIRPSPTCTQPACGYLRREPKVLLVAPKYTGTSLDLGLGKDVMKVGNLHCRNHRELSIEGTEHVELCLELPGPCRGHQPK